MRYLADVVLVVMAAFSLKYVKKLISLPQIKYFLIAIAIFAVYAIINALANQVSIGLVLLALRNTFRFYVFTLLVILHFDQKDVGRVFNLLVIFQVLNILLSAYQYYFVTKNWDRIGGIFGTMGGVNGASNIYFLVLLIYFALVFIHQKGSLLKALFVIASTLLIAVVAEIKYYFIEFLVIAVVLALLNFHARKGVPLFATLFVGLVIGLFALYNYMPNVFHLMMNFDKLYAYMTMTDGGYYLGRIGAFNRINEQFFNHEPVRILFGLGFGNCEDSSIPFLMSEFANKYGHLNYRFFSHVLTYLETGWIGVVLYLSTYLALVMDVIKNAGVKLISSFPSQMIILLFISILMIFPYNHSLKYELSYLIHFALAVPFILCRPGSIASELDETVEINRSKDGKHN
jgi:hypothetical protein